MDWVEPFYSKTDHWWGEAEAAITDVERLRAAATQTAAPFEGSVLELGCGSGATALATAELGLSVTGIDLSARLDRATRGPSARSGSVTFIKADFTTATFDHHFDVVSYWDGFGVGTDHDQQQLLQRIAKVYLQPHGAALIEVFDPTGFSQDHGLEETLHADPSRGYQHSLGHRRTFDADSSIAHDTWWELGANEEWTQSLRCYTLDEFEALLSGTGLRLDHTLDQFRNDWAYCAVLRPV